MPTIEIDWDVYKAISLYRNEDAQTVNDVLRFVFSEEIEQVREPRQRYWNPRRQVAEKAAAASQSNNANLPFVTGKALFADGTPFRLIYRGRVYNAIVRNGSLVLEGSKETFANLSRAAMKITGGQVISAWDRWDFYDARTGKWKKAREAAKEADGSSGVDLQGLSASGLKNLAG